MPILLNDSHYQKSYPAVYVHIPLTQVTFLLVAASTGVDSDAHWTDGEAYSVVVPLTAFFPKLLLHLLKLT